MQRVRAPERPLRSIVLSCLVRVALALLLVACAPARRFEFTRVCMGVRASIVLYAPDAPRAEAAASAAFDELSRLEAMMSDYRADSEVSRLARDAGCRPVPISPELAHLLRLARRIHAESGGAFDITVAPAVELWRAARRTGALPDEYSLARVRGLIDGAAIHVETAASGITAQLPRKGMRIDLGAIAKGFAAQRAVALLRSLGYPHCLVALAGDIFAGDAPPREQGWRVALDVPPGSVLLLRNQGVSTSGDTEQFLEIGGVRYSHIVDPRSTLGATRRARASVIAPDGAVCDALATTACLLEPGEVAPLISLHERTACVLTDESGRTRIIDPCTVLRWSTPPCN
jgi:thiamine biosynthesis lipoprotein